MDRLLALLPVAAAVFAVPQFLPQLRAVVRTGDTAGVSWSGAALTSVGNAGWTVYFAASGLWTALVPSVSATVLAGLLAALLARHGAMSRSAAALAAGWAALLPLSWALSGPAGLGTVLTASFLVQVVPSVLAAYVTRRPTGIAAGTWLLILAELSCWAAYGMYVGDPRLMVLGWSGVVASGLVLARAWRPARPAT
jgi:uncharacterized protein with PQ loop repeat